MAQLKLSRYIVRLRLVLHSTSASQRGFTLVEMLVVAPIVLLVIAALVGGMVAMIGDSLLANSRATTAYNIQDALGRIEQDTRQATNFMNTFSYLSAPQGRDGNVAQFSYPSNGDLILTQQATTTSPYTAVRDLVYYANQPASCSVDKASNRILNTRILYFLSNGKLWRRTIVNPFNLNATPDANTVCSSPWQHNSCPTGSAINYTPGSTCQGLDEMILDNVTSFTTTYYTQIGIQTSDPTQATSLQVLVTVSQTVAGNTFTQTNALRATRRNDIATVPVPSAPTVDIYNPGVSAYNNPVLATFQFSSPSATSYTISTQVNGGSWSSPTSVTSTTFGVPTPYSGVPISIKVTANNDSGPSATSTTFNYTTSLWTACPLQNGWTNAGSSYPTYENAEYTMTSAKVVEIRGLIFGGPTSGTVCHLPVGIQPSATLAFAEITSGPNYGSNTEVDITQSGDIKTINANSAWLSLSGITYIPTSAPYTWTNLTKQNGWLDASPYASVSYATDSLGRLQMRGVMVAGTYANNTIMAGTLPAGLRPSEQYWLPSSTGNTAYTDNAFAINPAGKIVAKGDTTTSTAVNLLLYPGSASGWNTLTLQNNWSQYSTYTSPAYIKGGDGMVTIKGNIKNSGTPAVSSVIATLPAGFCPLRELTFIVDRSNSTAPTHMAGRINIAPASPGCNVTYLAGSATWTSLDNIRYVAEQ